jgi:protoglobin
LAGDVLADQTQQIVRHWRSGIIANVPNLARHSRSPEGDAIPEYLEKSNLRFQQWILGTCLRPYDQDWLNYRNEIALRHTVSKKNKDRRRAFDAFRAISRHHRIRCGHERDHQAVSRRKREFHGRNRKNASRLVQINTDTVSSLGRPIHGL